jgi:hypothetical protein
MMKRTGMTERTIPKLLWDYRHFYESELLWHREAIEELSTRKEPPKNPISMNGWISILQAIWCGGWIGPPQSRTLKIIHVD